MSLTSGNTTKTATSRTTPTVLIDPAAGERWNYIDVLRAANGVDAEISFDSGATWLPFPGNTSGWSGPFNKSDARVMVRPVVDGQAVTGLMAYARLIIYQPL